MSESAQQAILHAREIAMLRSINATVGWDERTQMPKLAGPYRAEQMTYLTGLQHRKQTDEAYGQLLDKAIAETQGGNAEDDLVACIRVLKRNYDKATQLPQSLVEAEAKNDAEGQQAWVEARQTDDFKKLQPYLERTVKLKRERAEAIGYDVCSYDALLDEFEPYEKTDRVRAIFQSLREGLVELLNDIVGSGRTASTDCLRRKYPIAAQREIGIRAASEIGFQFDQGRLDVTDHPFCTTLGPHDVRLTTRYDESFFSTAFFGTLHEAGHGIYEQGLREAWFELPPGQACSMAIHESQSRLWENAVGRSRSFWRYFYPTLQSRFGTALANCDEEVFFTAINQVQPSLIRVEADEVTYNLHIIIRFELEQALINGELMVNDLPSAWNEKYADILGVTPTDDRNGVLQDVHWGAGAIGYFPTYALGNLYAAQFLDQAEEDLGSLDHQFEKGEFMPLRNWLRENIHSVGQCQSASQLVQSVTNAPLSEAALLRRLRSKFSQVYQF